MPYIVQEIINENPNPVWVKSTATVQEALAKMVEHDYSQLPIVDNFAKPIGMVTSDSILRAIDDFGIGLDKLYVEHASVKADPVRDDSDIFELLDKLREKTAVLIVDGEGSLKGIVTNYDAADYFRRRAEDIMLVEDIESTIKDYILVAYKDDEDEVDEERLSEAVQRVTGFRREHKDKFKHALKYYLNLKEGGKVRLNDRFLEQTLSEHYTDEQPPRQFDDLVLSQYVDMLLDKDSWDRYQPAFNLERLAVLNLLNSVRRTRNALAHFRGDISQAQRRQLRWVARWLAGREEMINKTFALATLEEPVSEEIEPDKLVPEDEGIEVEIIPAEDEVEPGESRYAPLAIWLQNQHPNRKTVKPTFKMIEEIIGGPLPPAAYEHRSWWANDPTAHVQAQQWLDAGWRLSSINMTSEVARFTRVRDRQKAYIDFYSSVLTELREQPGFTLDTSGPQGACWHVLEYIAVKGTRLGFFSFSFGRGRVFRIELYIDSGDKPLNKGLFDGLAKERQEIERSLRRELFWQRLDNKRASRISIVFEDAAITNSQAQLDALRQTVVPATIDYKKVMLPRVQEIGKQIV
jgi:CBS domain-containing protein